MSKTVHLVPHTHWDREWYFTIEESRVLLMHDLSEALDYLETHPDFPCYVLDGQSVVVDDYLSTRPQDADRIRALNAQGRLRIGPWLTQTDSQVVGGESLIRNLTMGLEIARRHGEPMRVGYIPDSFGQSAALPMILNGFGIDSALFWRGKTERHVDDVNFLWTSPDGSRVHGTNLALGYQIGKYLESDPERLRARMGGIVDRLTAHASSDEVLVPCGHDQMPIQKDLPQLAELLNRMFPEDHFLIDSYEGYLAATFTDDASFPTYQGEFTEGKYTRVHRSIYSSRMDIKMLNAQVEAELTRALEPLLVVAQCFGLDYPRALVHEAWKLTLECHAHDSIGLCNSDRVNRDVQYRLTKALEIAHALENMTARLLALGAPREPGEDLLFVFNPHASPTTRLIEQELFVDSLDFALIDPEGNPVEYDIVASEPWDAQRIDRQIAHLSQHIPLYRVVVDLVVPSDGIGYTTYRIQYGTEGRASVPRTDPRGTRIERNGLSVEVREDGIHVHDRHGHWAVARLEESGDEGDSYNYSAPLHDLVIDSFRHAATGTRDGHGSSRVGFTANATVPATLDERANGTVSVPVTVNGHVEIRDGEDFCRIVLDVRNEVVDHRVRLQVTTDIAAEHSIADNQFGVIAREFEHPEANDFRELGWTEQPIPVYPMQSWCALAHTDGGVYVATRGLREYEITGADHDRLAVTLWRSYGAIGKDDLTMRPGRASGIKVPTPDAQLLKPLHFETAVGFMRDEHDTLGPSVTGQRLNTPERTFQVKKYNDWQLNDPGLQVPARFTLTSVEPTVLVSATKPAEDGNGTVIRLFNPSTAEVNVATPHIGMPTTPSARAHRARLDETEQQPAEDHLPVRPCQAVTLVYR